MAWPEGGGAGVPVRIIVLPSEHLFGSCPVPRLGLVFSSPGSVPAHHPAFREV